MKNIQIYNVKSLSRNELVKIEGGNIIEKGIKAVFYGLGWFAHAFAHTMTQIQENQASLGGATRYGEY